MLKSIIAEDASGAQSMSEWAIEETRMVVERITGKDETEGWTVSWKGRGWYDTFAKYLEFFDEALSLAQSCFGAGRAFVQIPPARCGGR